MKHVIDFGIKTAALGFVCLAMQYGIKEFAVGAIATAIYTIIKNILT